MIACVKEDFHIKNKLKKRAKTDNTHYKSKLVPLIGYISWFLYPRIYELGELLLYLRPLELTRVDHGCEIPMMNPISRLVLLILGPVLFPRLNPYELFFSERAIFPAKET